MFQSIHPIAAGCELREFIAFVGSTRSAMMIIGGPLKRACFSVCDFFRLSTPQFTILLVGISMCVVSSVHIPRREQNQQLESHLSMLYSQEALLLIRLDEVQRERLALDGDPFYRRESLRMLTGQNLSGEMTLRELLRNRTATSAPTR